MRPWGPLMHACHVGQALMRVAKQVRVLPILGVYLHDSNRDPFLGAVLQRAVLQHMQFTSKQLLLKAFLIDAGRLSVA